MMVRNRQEHKESRDGSHEGRKWMLEFRDVNKLNTRELGSISA